MRPDTILSSTEENQADRQTSKRTAVSLHVFSVNNNRFTSQMCMLTRCGFHFLFCWKPRHTTFSRDPGNYVFCICSLARWAFVPLSLLILSFGVDVSQEQPTALIWPPPFTLSHKTSTTPRALNEFTNNLYSSSTTNRSPLHQPSWLQIRLWLLPPDGERHVGSPGWRFGVLEDEDSRDWAKRI